HGGRHSGPDSRRVYKTPGNGRCRGQDLPLPAVIGATMSFAAWVSIVIYHPGGRYVGFGWMLFGIALYVIYRTTQDKSLLRRVVVPEAALRGEGRESKAEY